jgi:hypothetical protein
MTVPQDVYQALNDAKLAWERLSVSVPQNKAKWSVEQQKALGIHADIAMHTYNAISRLVTALAD